MSPVEQVMRWSRWKATGSEDAISKVLAILDANLPSGWRRLTGEDLFHYRSLNGPGAGWYRLDASPSCGGVVLSIDRPGESELRGGWVWFDGPPPSAGGPGDHATWDDVGRFLDEGIVPAARAAGASVRVPSPQEVFFSDLPHEVGNDLRRFSDAACNSLPLNGEEAELWREFVIAAFRANAVIEAEPFIDWLGAAGWPRNAATELNAQLVNQWRLLSQYADEVSAA